MKLRINDKSSHRLRIGNRIDEGAVVTVTTLDCSDAVVDFAALRPGSLLVMHGGNLHPVNGVEVMLGFKESGWRRALRRVCRLFARRLAAPSRLR